MPDPKSDSDQLRFAQIRSRMLDGLVEHLPPYYLQASGAKSREDLRDKIAESESILSIIDVCAYVAQQIEEESLRRRR